MDWSRQRKASACWGMLGFGLPWRPVRNGFLQTTGEEQEMIRPEPQTAASLRPTRYQFDTGYSGEVGKARGLL